MDCGIEESSNQLITMLIAAIFVCVGVDSNHFRYVWDIKVVVQGLVGMFGGFWCWMACCIPIALSHMSKWVAVLPCIRLVCCLGIAAYVCLLASSCF